MSDLVHNDLDIRLYRFTSASVGASSSSQLNQKSFTVFRKLNETSFVVPRFPNKCRVVQYQVLASASGDFDVEIYPDDDFTVNHNVLKSINNANNTGTIILPNKGFLLYDEDLSNELHIKLINNDPVNASTFTVKLWLAVIEE